MSCCLLKNLVQVLHFRRAAAGVEWTTVTGRLPLHALSFFCLSSVHVIRPSLHSALQHCLSCATWNQLLSSTPKFFRSHTHTQTYRVCPVSPLLINGHATSTKGGSRDPLQPGHRREMTRSLPDGIYLVSAPHTQPHTGGRKLEIIQTLY